MNSYDETHLLMCEKEELVKYILELRDNDEEAMKLSMSQNERFMNQLERKDNQLETKDRLIECRGEEIAKSHIDINSLTAELELADFEIHRLEGELEETVNVMEDITKHPDYEAHMNKYPYELEEENNELKRLNETRKRLYLKSYNENKELNERNDKLEEELNRFPENSAGYTQEEFEEMVNVMEDITEHPDYDNLEIEEDRKKWETEIYKETEELKARIEYLERNDEEDNIEDICKDIIKTIVDGVVGP